MTAKNKSFGEKAFLLTKQGVIGLCITLLLFLSLGLCYSYYTPLWSPPDEERHFAYLEYIAQNHKLPYLKLDQEYTHIAQAIHPPLYYLIASLLCKNDGKVLSEQLIVNDGPGFNTITHPKHEGELPYSGKARSAHLLRYFSLVLSSATICFIYLMVLAIFPGKILLASATALFAGMNPQFLHISASVSNENLSTALSTIYLFALLFYLNYPVKTRHHIATGLLLGGCLLSKTSTLFFLPLTICVVAWITFRDKRKLFESLLLICGMAGLVAGWWYVRNWLVFDDPLLSKFLIDSQPWGLRSTPFSLSYVTTILSNTFISFFGYFGAMQIVIPGPHLIVYGGITGLGGAGLCRMFIKRDLTSLQTQALVLLFLSLLGGLAIFASLNISYRGVYMGRYLFVVIAPIAILTCTGIYFLMARRWRNVTMIIVSLVLILLNMDVLLRTLKPAYAAPSLTVGVNQPLFCCPTVEIDKSTTIAQSFISPQNNLAAIRVMFSNSKKPQSGEILFSLKEGRNQDKILRQVTFPLKHIKDNARYFFIFPPIKDSMNKEYSCCFSSPSQSAEHGISLWYESGNAYPEGTMMLNTAPVPGDIYFTAYHFSGNSPETDWQGRKELVIEQGLYVGLRELQLYNERSREFREQTLTHKKIVRFQKALQKR